jgi:beta-lactam-binding protein with PASTA domain
MPSFVGRKLGEAQAEIEAAGFVLGTVVDKSKAVPTAHAPAHTPASPAAAAHSSDPPPASAAIVKQYPAAGQRIMKGDRISFEVLR